MKKKRPFFCALFFTTKIIHGAGQYHIYAEILQKIKLSNLNQYCMDLLQTFSPDQNVTKLGEIRSSKAGYKVANCLIFNGNLIDIIINISTTKALIKILISTIFRSDVGLQNSLFLCSWCFLCVEIKFTECSSLMARCVYR